MVKNKKILNHSSMWHVDNVPCIVSLDTGEDQEAFWLLTRLLI